MRWLVCLVMLFGCETVQVRPSLETAPTEAEGAVVEETSPLLAAISLGVGPRSSCAVLADESLWCWGDGDDGLLGGDSGPGPVRVLEAAGLSQVMVGHARVCFLADEGLRCFGDLGYGRDPVRTAPTAVPGVEGVSQFALADEHLCFVGVDGRARCVGTQSRAGDGARANRPSNTLATSAQSVSAGLHHSCALVGGGVQCWGVANGRLGGANVRYYTESARPVPDLAGVRSISTHGSGSQTCALLADDEIRCWGLTSNTNRHGHYALVSETPLPLEPVGEAVASVVTGLMQVFAITDSGVVYRYMSQEPVSEEEPNGRSRMHTSYGSAVRLELPAVSTIGVGLAHTCALTQEGAVLCWGLGGGGRLGNGTNGSLSTPTRVQFEGSET